MYSKKKTKNGIDVVVSSMPQMNSVSMGIWIGVGGRYESKEESGISHYVEHLLFKGTHKRSTKQLKEAIEGIGGVFNGFTSDEVTCYMVKVPEKYTKLGIDVLSDMVINPKFDPIDLEKEKQVICEEIKMYRDQPAEYVMEVLGSIMWPDNPLGRALTGTLSTVKGFKKEQILKFKESNYHSGNMGFFVVGKTEMDDIFDSVESSFENIQKENKATFVTPKIKQKEPKLKVSKGETNQTHISFGFPMMEQNKKIRFAIKLMNVILGGNMSSRLFEELREKYGLCYDISSSYKRHSDVGEIVIHSGVDTKKTFRSVVAVLDELKKIRDIGVTEDELVRAKEYAKGQMLLSLESTSNRMLWLGDRLMVHKEIPEIADLIKDIDGVTSEDIKTACEDIFRRDRVNLALVGDIKTKERDIIRKELGKL